MQESTSAGIAINMVTSLACVTRRGSLLNVVHPKHISCKLVKSTSKIYCYAASQVISHQVINPFVYNYRYRICNLIPGFPHNIILLPILNIDCSMPPKSVPESQIRYICQCKHNACEYLQISVPGPGLYKACTQW